MLRHRLAPVSLVVAVLAGAGCRGGAPDAAATSGRLLLDGGVELRWEAEDGSAPGLGPEQLPRDPDRLLALWRRESFPAAPRGLRLRDPEGALARLVRSRARSLSRGGRPLLLVGWDGADPRVLEDLIEAGHLPHVRSLTARGVLGRLRSHAPYLSPLLWTSIATGKRPEEHGILDFVEPGPGGILRPIGSHCLRSTTLWEIASDLGRKVALVNWWATEPAPEIDGRVISDRWVREPGAQPGRGGDLDGWRVSPADPALERVVSMLVRGEGPEDPRVPRLREFLAETLTAHRVGMQLAARLKPDLLALYSGLPDQAEHLFFRETPPRRPEVSEAAYARFGGVVPGSYLLLDALLGDLVGSMPEDTVVLLVSDHGFLYGTERVRGARFDDPRNDALHSPEGVYLLAGERVVPGPGPTLDLHDVMPTALAVLGIPAARDMAGRVAGELLRVTPPPLVPTHEVRLDPPPLGLLSGEGCGGEQPAGEGGSPEGEEALAKLRALGYLAEGKTGSGLPVLPVANYARSLLDAGDAEGAARALRVAVERRPEDAELGALELEAALRAPGVRAGQVEALATERMRRGAPPWVAFVLVQRLLVEGRFPEARARAEEAGKATPEGALAGFLAFAWTGRREEGRERARLAAAADPVRAVDLLQALVETYPDRDLGVDAVLEGLAASLPLAEIARAPVGQLTGNPGPALDRARRARARAPEDRTVADRLWIRRAGAYGALGAAEPPPSR